MSFATTSQRPDVFDAVLARGSANFPNEIVRLVLEVSATPGRRADDDQLRQRTAYTCCLVSKEVKAWVEPMLYEKVVLQSSHQVMAFLDALESKSAEFLARTVKTVWFLNNSFPEKAVDLFRSLFNTCISLRSFACLGKEPCGKLLQFIPRPQNGSHALRELTIIQPGQETALYLDLTHLSIQRLQTIDGYVLFAMALYRRASTDEMFVDALREIPHISFDFMDVPGRVHTLLIKSKLVLFLLTRRTPGSNSVLCLRCRPITSNRPDAWMYLNDADYWVEKFDAEVQRCGGKLLVCVKSDLEVGIKPGASRIERCRQWIGLD